MAREFGESTRRTLLTRSVPAPPTTNRRVPWRLAAAAVIASMNSLCGSPERLGPIAETTASCPAATVATRAPSVSVPALVESLPRRLYPVTWCPRLRSSAAMREPTIPVAPNIAIFMGHVPSSICADAPRYPMVTWYLKVTNGAFNVSLVTAHG